MITCFRHYDILAKTRTRMTTAIAFSRQNNTGSRGRITSRTRSRPRLRIYIVKVCILARHGIFLTALRNKPKLKKKSAIQFCLSYVVVTYMFTPPGAM